MNCREEYQEYLKNEDEYMFTPTFWEEEYPIGNALYRVNQSPYKEFCLIDEFYTFLASKTKMTSEEIGELYQAYAEYVEERTRIKDINKAMNSPEASGMKKNVKYKWLEAQF